MHILLFGYISKPKKLLTADFLSANMWDFINEFFYFIFIFKPVFQIAKQAGNIW